MLGRRRRVGSAHAPDCVQAVGEAAGDAAAGSRGGGGVAAAHQLRARAAQRGSGGQACGGGMHGVLQGIDIFKRGADERRHQPRPGARRGRIARLIRHRSLTSAADTAAAPMKRATGSRILGPPRGWGCAADGVLPTASTASAGCRGTSPRADLHAAACRVGIEVAQLLRAPREARAVSGGGRVRPRDAAAMAALLMRLWKDCPAASSERARRTRQRVSRVVARALDSGLCLFNCYLAARGLPHFCWQTRC
jgi:hypothetical protein